MTDRHLIRLRRALAPLPLIASLAAGIGAFFAAVLALGADLGIGGVAGLGAICVALYGISAVMQRSADAERRESNREQAIRWSGPAGTASADHFDVRKSQERIPETDLAPYIERNVSDELLKGLEQRGLVIVTGQRPSGKSRLVYELLNREPERLGSDGTVILISQNAPSDGDGDPLIALMEERGALGADTRPTVLVLRDFVTRLIQRTITADFLLRWIDREDQVTVVVTLSSGDLADIQGSPRAAEDFRQLKDQASCVIPLSAKLEGNELTLATEMFPALDQHEREWLPAYLCSAAALRAKFTESIQGDHALGHALVRAVADWRRAGMTRPASVAYIRATIGHHTPEHTTEDFEAQLVWATEPVEGTMSLIRRVGDGYLPDRIIVDVLDCTDRESRQLPDHVWQEILQQILREQEDGRNRSVTVRDLIALSETAAGRSNLPFGRKTLNIAKELAGVAAQGRIGRARESIANPGSSEAVVSARVEDSPRARLMERQRLVNPESIELPGRFVAWFYSRLLTRALTRTAVLVLADSLSIAIGFVAGIAIRSFTEGAPVAGGLSESLRWLPVWVVGGIFVLVRVSLYKQDAPRARFSPLLLAGTVLGCVGLISTSLGNAGVGLLPEVVVGTSLAVVFCYCLRAGYDHISRQWVKNHGLQGRTLLIGSKQQYTEFADPLSKSSRPTEVVGFVSLRTETNSGNNWLGTAEELPAVARRHNIGRVVIVDTNIPPNRRQELANICHRKALKVEAVPSIADIRSGSVGFTAGQAITLINLEPLWQADLAFLFKRAFDVISASLGIVVLTPAWAWVAFVLHREGGPVFVREDRRGKGDRLFMMYRLRTTPVGEPTDSNDGDEQPVTFTKIGRRLKERGLDELPQLWNVIVGDMSLVGPRPLHFHDRSRLSSDEILRYVVKPGMTGPWLVSQHTQLTYAQLAALDVAYLQSWTFFTDLDILAQTMRLILRGRSAFPSLRSSTDMSTDTE